MQRRAMPFGSLLLLTTTFAACQIEDETDECMTFARQIRSVPVDPARVDDEFLFGPLPGDLRRLEAGFDPSCRVGDVADIEIQCPKGDDPRSQTIIRCAPVIWTDPKGFTVVAITAEDHEKLGNLDPVCVNPDDPGPGRLFRRTI